MGDTMQLLRNKAKELLLFPDYFDPDRFNLYSADLFGTRFHEPNKFRIATFLIGLGLSWFSGFFSGNTEQKGWIAGLSSALIVVVIVAIIQLFAKDPFTWNRLIKYLAFLASGTFGGILGVNFKRLF